MKRTLALLIMSIFLLGLIGCGSNDEGDKETTNDTPDSTGNVENEVNEENSIDEVETRVITDGTGTEVELAQEVTKVVNLWNSANQLIFQLGGGDLMVGGSSFLQERAWMTHIYPRAAEIEVISDGATANNEAIMSLGPDVIVSVAGRADALKELGEPVVELTGGKTYDELMKQIGILAKALGPEYEKNAEDYFEYFNKNLELAKSKTANITEEERLTVMHGSTSSVTLDDSLTGSLIKELNATNAFAGATGSEVSYEQILAANPDVIIVSTGKYAEYEKFMTDPLYQDVNAVKNDRVYINPAGMFYWDAFSGEAALQTIWVGQTLYPEYFEDVDLAEETRYFYSTFLGYDMTDEEITYLYEGKGPNGEWQ